MDPNVLVAIIGCCAALGGSLIGTIPMYLTARNNNAAIDAKLESLKEQLNKIEAKNNNHDIHSIQIAEINARLDAHDDHITRLSRYHSAN